MKLFQIEEPQGGPPDPEMPGAAIGIDASGAEVQVAVAVGGNAVILADREGFGESLIVPPLSAPAAQWQRLFEGARLRAERALARPATHAVVVLATVGQAAPTRNIATAAERAGLLILRLAAPTDLSAEIVPALAAAVLAEDLAPRPQRGSE